jgi:hypothetical protein
MAAAGEPPLHLQMGTLIDATQGVSSTHDCFHLLTLPP